MEVMMPVHVKPSRVDLWREGPGRLGGRVGDYGHYRPRVDRGAKYWRAEVSFNRQMRAESQYYEALEVEAVLTALQDGATMRVYVWRHDNFRRAYKFENQGTARVSANGARWVNTAGGKIEVRPGCFFTVSGKLYRYVGDTVADFASSNVTDTVPEWGTQYANEDVDLSMPYFRGVLPEGQTIQMPRDSDAYGPWTFQMVEVG